MEIVEAIKDDSEEVAKLLSEVISGSPHFSEGARRGEKLKYTPKLIEENLRDDKFVYLIARDDSRNIVGYCFGHYDNEKFFGDWLGVAEKSRLTGFATALLSNLFIRLKNRGINKMQAHTRLDNKESISLLQKLDFQKTGLVKANWYGEDSLVWEKDF